MPNPIFDSCCILRAPLGISSSDEGVSSCLQCGAPYALVQLVKRVMRHPLEGQELLLLVLRSALSALQQISHHADGKAAIREAHGIEGGLHLSSLHFMICHSAMRHIPCTSNCHKERRGGAGYRSSCAGFIMFRVSYSFTDASKSDLGSHAL